MRKATALFVFLLALTVLLVCASALVLGRIASRQVLLPAEAGIPVYRRHVMLIAERTDFPFWQKVYEGARKTGIEHGAVVELAGPVSGADLNTAGYWIDYAASARVQGILAYTEDLPSVRSALDAAAEKGIPVVTLENDIAHSARKSFAGVSGHSLGKILGGLIRDSAGTTGNVAVVLDGGVMKPSDQIMMSAMREALLSSPGIRVGVLYPLLNERSAGESVRRRLLEDTSLDTIVCLSVEDTMQVSREVIDLNRADGVSVIAFGESKEIFEYVRKGIVYAVVMADAEQMGTKSAEALFEYLDTGNANDYVITDLHVISRDNVGEYLE